MTNLIKQAEENLVNICKVFDDLQEILKAISSVGNKYCHEYVAKNDFLEGLQMMTRAIDKEHANAVRNCFMFAGVGGEKAKQYSLKMFREIFNEKERFAIMHFLDKYGQIPSSYKSTEEEEFRRQAKLVKK